MKYMFIQDIHGNVDNLNKAFEAFQGEGSKWHILSVSGRRSGLKNLGYAILIEYSGIMD